MEKQNSYEKDFLLNDTLSRSEFLIKTPLQDQIKLSKTLSPSTQAKLWLIKIEDTLSSQDLSEEEKSVIRSIVPFLTEGSFEEGNTSLARKCDQVYETLTTQYAWDEEKIFIYLSNFYTFKEYVEYVKK